MKVALLSPYPDLLKGCFAEDTLDCNNGPPDTIDWTADFFVSFGYRHIIRQPRKPVINLHISYLPWNRGADPNFWSWFDHTPKGVTIHYIDHGIDTGPIIAQKLVLFDKPKEETLVTSYRRLQSEVAALFAELWPHLRRGFKYPIIQKTGGTFHKKKDKDRWWSLLPKGYDTPVLEVAALNKPPR